VPASVRQAVVLNARTWFRSTSTGCDRDEVLVTCPLPAFSSEPLRVRFPRLTYAEGGPQRSGLQASMAVEAGFTSGTESDRQSPLSAAGLRLTHA
jgi:hypothetical protein